MPKKFRFRGTFDKQHGKGAQTLLKSWPQHLYHIDWSLPSQLSLKKSLLLTCQILRLLVNTLAADEKYPVLNRGNLMIPIQMQLCYKQRTFSRFFAVFLKFRLKFEHLEKKIARTAFVVLQLGTPKTWLDKCLKSDVLEEPSTSTVVNFSKHCWNMNHSTVVIFIDHCQVIWVGKGLSYWHAKCFDSLWTHWLQMKSILIFKGTI